MLLGHIWREKEEGLGLGAGEAGYNDEQGVAFPLVST